MVDPRGRVRVSRVSQVERTAPSSNMIKPVSRAPFTSRAAKPPVVSPNQSRFNQMSPERQQKFQDIQDANGVNFGATRPIYQPGTLGAQNQGVQYTPISRQIPMTPSSAQPAPQQVGEIETWPPKPIMAPPGTSSPHDMLKNGGAVQPTPSQAATSPYNIGGLSVPNQNGFLPSTERTMNQISQEGEAYRQQMNPQYNPANPPVMPPNLTPEQQQIWADNLASSRNQYNQGAVNDQLSGGGSRLMGPNGMPVRGGGGGYLPPTAGGSGLPLKVTTGRDGKPVLRPDGSPMVETVKPPETAYPPLSQEALAAREAMRLKHEAAEKARREKALGIAPQTAPASPSDSGAAGPEYIAGPGGKPQPVDPSTPSRALLDPRAGNPPAIAAPATAPPAVNHRADSSNAKWMAAREKRKGKHEAARLKRTELAERESQLRQDRINWRKQMALPPSPETVIAMEAVRRGQLGGQGGLLDQRRDNMMMWGMMNQNQMDRERMQIDRDRMKSEDEYRKSQQDLDRQRANSDDEYRKSQQDAQKAETDIMKDMSSPDALEYKSLMDEYAAVAATDPAKAEEIYDKAQQARERWVQSRRASTSPPPGGPIAPGTAPPPPQGGQPTPQGTDPITPGTAPGQPPAIDPQKAAKDARSPKQIEFASRYGLDPDPMKVTADSISTGLLGSFAPPEKGEQNAAQASDADIDELGRRMYTTSPTERPTGFSDAPHFKWGIESELRVIGDPNSTKEQKDTARKRVRALASWTHTRKKGTAADGPTVDGYVWKYEKISNLGGGSTHMWGWKKAKK